MRSSRDCGGYLRPDRLDSGVNKIVPRIESEERAAATTTSKKKKEKVLVFVPAVN